MPCRPTDEEGRAGHPSRAGDARPVEAAAWLRGLNRRVRKTSRDFLPFLPLSDRTGGARPMAILPGLFDFLPFLPFLPDPAAFRLPSGFPHISADRRWHREGTGDARFASLFRVCAFPQFALTRSPSDRNSHHPWFHRCGVGWIDDQLMSRARRCTWTGIWYSCHIRQVLELQKYLISCRGRFRAEERIPPVTRRCVSQPRARRLDGLPLAVRMRR